MNGFVSTPPAPASPVASTVAADGWFPAVDVNSIRDRLRIGEGIVTHERLVAAIEGAMLTALRALASWRSAFAAAGVASLDEVPCDNLNGTPVVLVIWERIVRFYAGSEVLDLHRDISATDQIAPRAEGDRLTADECRRLAHAAVADMLSIGATTMVQRNRVELI